MTALVIALVLLAVASFRWSADTRDGRDWQPGSWGPDPVHH